MFQDNFEIVKTLGQEFKVVQEKLLEVIAKQNQELKTVSSELKTLKKKLWKNEIGSWMSQAEDLQGLPFLFLGLTGYESDEIKDIASHLQKTKPGFYFIISHIDSRYSIFASLSQEFKSLLNLKKLSSYLKANYNIQSGGSELSIQGGSIELPDNLKEIINEAYFSEQFK